MATATAMDMAGGMTSTDDRSVASDRTHSPTWGCVHLARHTRQDRVPVGLAAPGEAPASIGSVERTHLAWLRDTGWALAEGPAGLVLTLPRDGRDAALAAFHGRLRDAGVIRAWRDEPYPLLDAQGRLQAVIERASARFWGCLTFGAHCNGYVTGPDGRPSHLWVARRAEDKPTDPGRLDNLIGGGVPYGQTPREALLREAWEEAGLTPDQMAGITRGRVIELCCDIPEGLQREWLHVYDLALPPGLQPVNQDGEVAWHRLMPVAQALDHAARGDMTVDAALATLDFALRHGLLPAAEAAALAEATAALWVAPERAERIDPPVPATV